jgi:predicted RNA-binding protein with PUA-like domain
VQLVKKFPLIPLATLRNTPALADLRILQRGNRLSITPVDEVHWERIMQLAAL